MRIPLNTLDEMFLHLDVPPQPLNVHLEVRVKGTIDESRLEEAIRTAVATHELARGRLVPWSTDAETYEWHVDAEPNLRVNPLQTINVGESADIDAVRADLYSRPIPLFETPPFRMLLVHHPGGDFVMLAFNHVAADGIGTLRFLQSLGRAYAGLPDPTPDIDAAEAHSLAVPDERPGIRDRLENTRTNLQQIGQMRSRPAKLTAQDPSSGAGYGVHTMALPLKPLAASELRRRLGATLNDVLLAAIHRSIDEWNTQRGKASGRISISIPVNARPDAWRYDVVGNLITSETVWTTKEQRESPETCLAAVAGWTETVKRRGPGPALAAQAKGSRGRVSQRRAFSGLMKASASLLGGTVSLSNLGRIAPDWIESPDFGVTEMWFSPPPTATSLGIGAVSVADTLHLGLRYSPSVLSNDGARAFAELLRAELDLLSGA